MLQQSSAKLGSRWGQSLESLNFHSSLKMLSGFKGFFVSSLSHPPPPLCLLHAVLLPIHRLRIFVGYHHSC